MWVCITQRRKEGFFWVFFFKQVEETQVLQISLGGEKNIKVMTNKANK